MVTIPSPPYSVDGVGATTPVACLGALVVPVSSSAAAALVSPTPVWAASGGGERDGVSVPHKLHLRHAVVLCSRECICNICRVDVPPSAKVILILDLKSR